MSIDVSKDMLCYIITCRDICNKNIKNLLKTCQNELTLYMLYVIINLRKRKSNANGGDSICLIKINLEQRLLRMGLL